MDEAYEFRKAEREVHAALNDYINHGDWRSIEDVNEEAANSFLKLFLDACHKGRRIPPDKLEPEQLKEVLLSVMPKHVSPKRKAADKAIHVVQSYYGYLSETADFDAKPYAKVLKDAIKLFPDLIRGDEKALAKVEKTVDKAEPLRNEDRAPGRNDPCSCGSGKKYKKCCMKAAGA